MCYSIPKLQKEATQYHVERSVVGVVKTQYVDEEAIRHYIKSSGIKIGAICDALGISRQAFRAKCKGDISFRASEVYVLCDMARIPSDERAKIFCLKG